MTATEVAADVVEDVAEATTEILRDAPGRDWGLAGAAFLIGAGIGGGLAYLLAAKRLKTKYETIANDEIAEVKAHYQAKGRALEADLGKGDLTTLVAEKGYISNAPSERPPMAVQPPASVVVAEDEAAGEPPDDSDMAENDVEGAQGLKKPSGVPEHRNIFRDREKERERWVPEEWNVHEERRRRDPMRPYVIHRDERYEMEDYQTVSITYYAGDDVVCNDNDEIMDPDERDRVLGEKNLDRFGHGSGEPDIVYIRNDSLEIVYEVVKSPNAYAEEVHGFQHDAWDTSNLEKMRRQERDGPEN